MNGCLYPRTATARTGTSSIAGVHLASAPVLVLGALLTGIGFGTDFLGCIGAIVPLAGADERAGLLSVFYMQSYLAFAAIGAGLLVKSVGYATTADIFGGVIFVTNLAGLLVLRRGRTAVAA